MIYLLFLYYASYFSCMMAYDMLKQYFLILSCFWHHFLFWINHCDLILIQISLSNIFGIIIIFFYYWSILKSLKSCENCTNCHFYHVRQSINHKRAAQNHEWNSSNVMHRQQHISMSASCLRCVEIKQDVSSITKHLYRCVYKFYNMG